MLRQRNTVPRSNQRVLPPGASQPLVASDRATTREQRASLIGRSQPWLAAALLLVAAAGCGKDHKRPQAAGGGSVATSSDKPISSPGQLEYGPKPSDPCLSEGEVRECGRVYQTDGDYVTCSVGYQTCTTGAWGECIGDHLVIKSAPSLRLTSAGLRFQSMDTGTCTNACDPYCVQVAPDHTDVSAPGIVAADAGGVTLEWHDIEVTSAAECVGLQCQLALCGGAATTTISGRVFDPAGKNPLYNAEVYIPLHPSDPLPVFGSGASCDTCGGAAALDAIRATQTDANGNFVLADVPAGAKIPVVVQMGKWRREIVLSSVTACTDNAVKNNCTAASSADCVFRLPRNQQDGFDPKLGTYTKADLPQTAIVTGSADPFDCLLLKAGIDPNEIGDKGSSKRIHYYTSDGGTGAGGSTLDPAYGVRVDGSTLWNNLKGSSPNMMSYDVVLLPCEGGTFDKQKAGANTPYQNLVDYVNSGGRTFATHYAYSWLAFPAAYAAATDNWSSVVNWGPARVKYTASTSTWSGGSVNTQDPLTGLVNTAFPKGSVFSQWLSNVGASATPGRLMIHEGRQDLTSLGSNAQSWMTAKDLSYQKSPTYPNLFTFNTPYSAPAENQCGRVVYSDFHVSAAARTQCPFGNCDDACLNDRDCGYTATCNGETTGAVGTCNEPCATNLDCPNSSFSCNGVVAGTCTQTACTLDSQCGYGRTCQSGSCTCSSSADCSGGTCVSMTCDPGTACHSNAQCGKGICGHGTGSTIGSCAAGFVCHKNADCGPTGTCGSGTSSTKGICARTGGFACHKNADCDSNSCGSGTGATVGTCSYGASTVCHANNQCDSNSCGSGSGSTVGTCSTGATACHTNAQCDSGACGSGAGSTAGTCATNGQICHSNAQCDNGACGSGTGSSPGVCSLGASTSCHLAGDCDSNSCGAGTGSTPGTCAIAGGTACHVNGDCDSNSCGAGTGSSLGTCNTNGQVCHANNQCDSAACGTGLNGSVKGTCNTNGKVCHANSQCDSAACGTGASGSVKGVCNALGSCTSNTQCTGGATCVAGKCAGTCSVDTNCAGTGGGGQCVGATCTNAAACGLDTNCPVSGQCNGATCTTNKTCATDAACGVSNLCNGAKCSSPAACAGDTTCFKSQSCSGAKCSTPAACTSDAACTRSLTCTGAKCGNAAVCAGDAACGASHVCNGAKCATKACATDSVCTVGGLCNNAKCSTPATCGSDSACPSSGLCNNAKCSTAATCAGDAACPSSGLCTGSKCSTSTCGADSECPLGLCSNARCNASDCSADSDCASGAFCGGSCTDSGCTKNSDCASGICSNGVCGCVGQQDCGGAQSCSGDTLGSCGRACTSDSQCAPDRCVNGQCGGCSGNSDCHDFANTATCTGIPAGNYGTCSNASPSEFPVACKQGDLSPQEKSLEFMFFDLTACVSPDNLPPPKPVTSANYGSATFVQDFTSACKDDTVPVWRDFDWQAEIPDTASIDISAQTGDTLASLTPAVPVPLATATESTDVGPTQTSYDIALIDTGTSGSGAFTSASPRVRSAKILRVTITLHGTTDKQLPPRLAHWKVQYDCLPAQ